MGGERGQGKLIGFICTHYYYCRVTMCPFRNEHDLYDNLSFLVGVLSDSSIASSHRTYPQS